MKISSVPTLFTVFGFCFVFAKKEDFRECFCFVYVPDQLRISATEEEEEKQKPEATRIYVGGLLATTADNLQQQQQLQKQICIKRFECCKF